MIEERIERVKRMELYYDELLKMKEAQSGLNDEQREMLLSLSGYYESGLWLSDYEADERGELPAELKRGVLSQDGLYELFENLI